MIGCLWVVPKHTAIGSADSLRKILLMNGAQHLLQEPALFYF